MTGWRTRRQSCAFVCGRLFKHVSLVHTRGPPLSLSCTSVSCSASCCKALLWMNMCVTARAGRRRRASFERFLNSADAPSILLLVLSAAWKQFKAKGPGPGCGSVRPLQGGFTETNSNRFLEKSKQFVFPQKRPTLLFTITKIKKRVFSFIQF